MRRHSLNLEKIRLDFFIAVILSLAFSLFFYHSFSLSPYEMALLTFVYFLLNSSLISLYHYGHFSSALIWGLFIISIVSFYLSFHSLLMLHYLSMASEALLFSLVLIFVERII